MSTAQATTRRRSSRRQNDRGSDQPQSAVAVIEPKKALEHVTKYVNDRMDQLIALFGGDQKMAERMAIVSLHALAHPKLAYKLARADLATVLDAIRESAAMGLMPIGATSEGALVPYWNRDKNQYDFQFQPMYRGLLKLVRRSREVDSVDAQVVYENDDFTMRFGSSPDIQHTPALRDRGARLGTYAIAVLANGQRLVEWLSEADAELIRRSSKAADDGPWVDWPEEMRRKSAIRRLAKRLPLEHLAEDALRHESEIEERYGPAPAALPANGHAPATARARVQERLGVAAIDAPIQEASTSGIVEETEAAGSGVGHGASAASRPGKAAATDEGESRTANDSPVPTGAASNVPSEGAAPADFTLAEVDEVIDRQLTNAGPEPLWPEGAR